ncbi:hypothetical protein [Henriciella litoralis]|uniref:hypothetical protein n=1 Tax=Henriciella litoralis TaxID=568102 RepID=UPI0009FFFB06|nr:hypothetical protein [Henriciella litoralis]
MSLAYPLAQSGEDALKGVGPAARTRYEAEDMAGDAEILSLETEWLKPATADLPALMKQAESGEAKGFMQVYEDADGMPVLAVTFWKLGAPVNPKPAKAETKTAPASPETPPKQEKPKREEIDHTDDLYFRHGRTRKAPRKPQSDPRQMDLFVSPDQRGYERKDPNNPNTMLTEEEGTGTTFGGGESGASEED